MPLRRWSKPWRRSMTTELEFHPAANLFPLLEEDSAEFKELVEDIKAHGQQLPILTFEGKILDGRNRYRACRAAGVKPEIGDVLLKDGQGPVDFVLSLNERRRHLTP